MILGLLDYRIMLICLVAFLLCVVITGYVSLGSLIVVVLFFTSFLVLGLTGRIENPATHVADGGKPMTEAYVIIFIFAALAFYRHKANIIRLAEGTENKIFSKKKEIES